MIEYLRLLKTGVRNMSYGDPYEGPTVPASDVVQWAIDEIARLRLTDAERDLFGVLAGDYEAAAARLGYVNGIAVKIATRDAATLRGLLERHKENK